MVYGHFWDLSKVDHISGVLQSLKIMFLGPWWKTPDEQGVHMYIAVSTLRGSSMYILSVQSVTWGFLFTWYCNSYLFAISRVPVTGVSYSLLIPLAQGIGNCSDCSISTKDVKQAVLFFLFLSLYQNVYSWKVVFKLRILNGFIMTSVVCVTCQTIFFSVWVTLLLHGKHDDTDEHFKC